MGRGIAGASRAKGTGYWTHDSGVGAWYFGLNERAPPPYRKQVFVEAILDLDASGRLAGIEIIDHVEGKPIEPPLGVDADED